MWPFRRRKKFEPDFELFNRLLHASVDGRQHGPQQVAQDFRALFLRTNPDQGKRVLFMLLHWCGEFEADVPSGEDLQRWAGKREVAARIKAALYADLTGPID